VAHVRSRTFDGRVIWTCASVSINWVVVQVNPICSLASQCSWGFVHEVLVAARRGFPGTRNKHCGFLPLIDLLSFLFWTEFFCFCLQSVEISIEVASMWTYTQGGYRDWIAPRASNKSGAPHVRTYGHSEAIALCWRKFLQKFLVFSAPPVAQSPGHCSPFYHPRYPLATPSGYVFFITNRQICLVLIWGVSAKFRSLLMMSFERKTPFGNSAFLSQQQRIRTNDFPETGRFWEQKWFFEQRRLKRTNRDHDDAFVPGITFERTFRSWTPILNLRGNNNTSSRSGFSTGRGRSAELTWRYIRWVIADAANCCWLDAATSVEHAPGLCSWRAVFTRVGWIFPAGGQKGILSKFLLGGSKVVEICFFPLEIKKTTFSCWKFHPSPPSDAHGGVRLCGGGEHLQRTRALHCNKGHWWHSKLCRHDITGYYQPLDAAVAGIWKNSTFFFTSALVRLQCVAREWMRGSAFHRKTFVSHSLEAATRTSQCETPSFAKIKTLEREMMQKFIYKICELEKKQLKSKQQKTGATAAFAWLFRFKGKVAIIRIIGTWVIKIPWRTAIVA